MTLQLGFSAVGFWFCWFVAAALASRLGALTAQDSESLLRTIFKVTLPLAMFFLIYCNLPLLDGSVFGGPVVGASEAGVDIGSGVAGPPTGATVAQVQGALDSPWPGSTVTAESSQLVDAAKVQGSLSSFLSSPTSICFAVAGVLGLHSILMVGATLMAFRRRAPVERSLLVASSVGVDLAAFGYTAVAVVLGLECMAVLSVVDVINAFLVFGAGFAICVFGGRGASIASRLREHKDGTVYDGEWVRANKEGFGVYKYVNGARYEGEWKRNLKHGKGIYYFADGGVYEGEWQEGLRSGTGVRTFSDGRMKGGAWLHGKLVTAYPPSQCISVAKGAAASAARARLAAKDELARAGLAEGGGSSLMAIVNHALTFPPLLAIYLAVALSLTKFHLSPVFFALAMPMQYCNAALTAAAIGVLLVNQAARHPVTIRQLRDASAVVGIRAVISLLLCACSAFVAGSWGLSQQLITLLSLVLLMPVPTVLVHYALYTRKDERLGNLIVGSSMVVSAVLCCTVASVEGGAIPETALYAAAAVTALVALTLVGLDKAQQQTDPPLGPVASAKANTTNTRSRRRPPSRSGDHGKMLQLSRLHLYRSNFMGHRASCLYRTTSSTQTPGRYRCRPVFPTGSSWGLGSAGRQCCAGRRALPSQVLGHGHPPMRLAGSQVRLHGM
mmetsp:Transcript_3735/g.13370  ORF Transcript_3735/g.13370 Transcript_3735/m.13370 type:complete len:671 (-) Transcript_3735:1739-3751(-)